MAGLKEPSKVESCVLCRRHPVDPVWRPFCSKRCKTQDLARWADESYRVPDKAIDTESETED